MSDGPRLGLLEGFRAHARHRGQTTALTDHRASYSFAELWDASSRFAARLRAAGIGPGGTVGVAMGGSAAHVAALLGTMLAGAASAPINIALTPSEVGRYLDILDPRLVVADPDGLAHLPSTTEVTEVDSAASSVPLAARLGAEGTEPFTGGLDRPSEAPALLFPTGGTTGLPKAAVLSHRATLLWALSMAGHGRAGQGTELYVLPFFHVGLMTGLLSTLHAGGPVIIQARFDPDRACDHILRDHASRLQVVPTHMRRMRESPSFAQARAWIRDVRFGGMSSAPEFVDELLEMLPNARISTSYGATEFGPVTKLAHDDLVAGRRTGVGRPVPCVNVTIQRPDGTGADPGEAGDVVVSCPWSASGYVGRPEETAATFLPRGVRLADVGALDDEGWLTLLGRRSDMVVTGGENVFPAEIESVLVTHPDIAEVVVYGVPDETWGQRVEAAVVARPGAAPTTGSVREFGRARLAPYKLPRSVRLLDRIPLTSTNKPDRRTLQAASADLQVPAPAPQP